MTTFADAIATPSGVALNPNLGRQAATGSRSLALCNEDSANLATIATNAASTAASPIKVGPFTAKEIAASQTTAILGATGAVGDYISHIIIQPATTSPGVVTLFDGSTAVYAFPGGASSLSNLAPIIVGIAANCAGAAWKVTTGANVAVTAIGSFT